MEIYLIGGSPAFRAEAKIVRLHQFTQEDIVNLFWIISRISFASYAIVNQLNKEL